MGLSSLFRRFSGGKKPGKLEFHVINAFTGKDDSVIGNPASICIVDAFPSDAQMGALAKTLGTAMTSFLRRTDKNDVYDVRHFSPDGHENHICGHALVAASEHLARQFPAFREGRYVTFLVNPKYALNTDNAMKAHIGPDGISLTLPAVTDLLEVKDAEFYRLLGDALGIAADGIIHPAFFAPRANNYLVVVKDQETLVSMQPDFAKINAISHNGDFLPGEKQDDKIVPFWCLTAKSDDGVHDVMNRVFSPDIGVDEDPACGSANCSIIPYWSLIDSDFSASGKNDFKVLYPYPPAGPHLSGGVQQIRFDAAKEEVVLTAKARFKKVVTLDIPAIKTTGPKRGL